MWRFGYALTIVCLLFSAAWANQVSYQGILTNSSGDSLLTGTYDFSFSIFPAQAGGTARWTEAHNDVGVQNGVYSVLLGLTNPLPDSIGVSNWLQITVEGTTLAPRLPITADFRAIEARHAQNSDSVNHIAARVNPTPNHLVPLGADGKFPEAVLPFTLDSILAGQGLTGVSAAPSQRGRNSLDERLTLNVGAGTGITVTADQVSATLGTSIATAEIEDNAVTTGKVQDNTLTAADIAPNIVSSVDGVSNDGGDIDLIAGANITITPNDANNTITIAAAGGGGGYSAGRCIELAGTTINNTMTITTGDSCIRVFYDPVTCSYQVSSDLDVYAGDCIEVEYDDVTCDWTVSVDPACIDSIYDTEIYAKSFVVTEDGTLENAKAHLTSDGYLIMHSDSFDMNIGPDGMTVTNLAGDTFEIGPRGWAMARADGKSAGTDSDGEVFAPSFWVRDPATGDTLIHLTSDGEIHVGQEDHRVLISPDHVSVFNEDTDSWTVLDKSGIVVSDSLEQQGVALDRDGMFIGDAAGQNGHLLEVDGTFASYQNGEIVAGLDHEGEIFANSFYVPNPQGGEPLIHLTNDGQILRNGIPIAGGEGDTIRREGTQDSMKLFSGGLWLYDTLSNACMGADSFAMGARSGSSKFNIFPDGCFESYQGGQKVAGIDLHGEIFAKSFYVRNANGDTITHLKNDGSLVMYDPASSKYIIVDPTVVQIGNNIANSGARMFPDGTIEVAHDSIVTVGVQPNGEIHAKSFEVRDSAGGAIKAHLTNDGFLDMQNGDFVSNLGPDGFTVTNNSTNQEFEIGPAGWQTNDGGLFPVAGVDSSGEIYARSFYTTNSEGDTIAHLTNEGNLELPPGAQVLIGGVPIGGGGIGDQVEFEDGSNSSLMNAEGVAVHNGTVSRSVLTGTGMGTSTANNSSYMDMQYDGTWEAKQNGVIVASLQNNGEIHAKSFEVRDSLSGALKAHLANSADLSLVGTISGDAEITTTVPGAGGTNNLGMLTPTQMCVNNRTGTNTNTGWMFYSNGTMTQYIDPAGAPPPMVNMQTTNDGYWQFMMPVFFGNPANFNYLSGGSVAQGIITSGNLTVNGKVNATGTFDPVICELFPVHPDYEITPGMVVVADRNSDFVIPCDAASQTAVIGVIPPDETIDERSHILVTIMGYAAAFREDGTRLEMRVKADAKYGAIRRGDLLTTSATPGHAMLAADPKLGTIVGKALESLESGTGEIKIMVTLQ